ncbi:MAG: hypothetical protein QM630_06735 [Microbacterium sp.]
MAFVLALAMLPFTAVAAYAATGDYTVEISAPSSVSVRTGFAYDVTIPVEGASTADPVDGIVLTAVLPEGVAFNSVDTNSGSPVASSSYDSATRTVTFTLNPLVQELVNFSFSVTQNDNNYKDSDTVFTTTITGSATPSGDTPSDSATTTVTGDHTYTPTKVSETTPGSTNRIVTYIFDINVDQGANTDTFASWGQRLTDTLPAGVEIVSLSDGWTQTANADGTTTLVWERTNNLYAPSQLTSIPDRSVWIQVNYPAATFPDGTEPPVNTVDLETQSYNGTWHDQTPATAQGPAFQPAVDTPTITVGKGYEAQTGLQEYEWTSGTIGRPSYQASASYLDGGTGENLESLTLTDSGSESGNAAFFDHFDTTRLDVRFNATLSALDVPYTFEYQTAAQPGVWQSFTLASPTSGTGAIIVVQTTGSAGYTDATAGYTDVLNLPLGTHLTGWRVTVSPDDATSITDLSEVRVYAQGTASYPSLTGGDDAVADTLNTATAEGETTGGAQIGDDDPMSVTVVDRINLINQVFAPASVTIGQTALYGVSVANRDPAGRTYYDDEVRVILPEGVYYAGGAYATATTTTLGRSVPQVGDGVTVTTETMVIDGVEHQVVVLTFDEIVSQNAVGTAKHERPIYGSESFTYRIPTVVQPQASQGAGVRIPVESWIWTADTDYTTVPMAFQSGYYATDEYDFDPNRTSISYSTQSSDVITSGGMLIGKLVRADDADSWSALATVTSPGGADYQVYAQNALPNDVTDVVLFDLLPAVGDGRDSEFDVTLAGAVQGAPTGSTVEYSTDATTATDGTWTTEPTGAIAFRVTIPTFESGVDFTLTFSVDVPSGVDVSSSAVNDVTATGTYSGATRNFTSTDVTIVTPDPPQAGDDAVVINPGETATLTPDVTPGTGEITEVAFDNGTTTKVVAGEGTWTIELVDGQPVATFVPEAGYHGAVTSQEYTVTDEYGLTATGELSVEINDPPQAEDASTTVPQGETATLYPVVTPGNSEIVAVTFADGSNEIVVDGEGTWTIELDADGNVVAVFTPEPDFFGVATPQEYTVTDENGLTDTAELAVIVTSYVPSMDLVKAADLNDTNGNGKADAGETIDYSFLLTNTGLVVLSNVRVDDPMLDDLGITITCDATTLQPGEAVICTADDSYTVTTADVENGTVHNAATGDADVPPGVPALDPPTSEVDVPTAPPSGLAVTGGTISFLVIAGAIAMLIAGAALMRIRRSRDTEAQTL